ncbi:MAG: SMC-Scp complex subunit ScpB [candidate division Zixibacteria bacterium]|nr:SMC-Scp complex subunit ScpB [candidate division Zixibacteria bacterium]
MRSEFIRGMMTEEQIKNRIIDEEKEVVEDEVEDSSERDSSELDDTHQEVRDAEELTEEMAEWMNMTEALLFASPEPVNYRKIARFLGKLTKAQVYSIVDNLNRRYTDSGHTFRIREIAEGFQFYLLPNMTAAVERFLKKQRERRLTQAGLETLAIIAYKQPVTKGEVEHIRGVGVDGTLNTLLDRKLVTIAGRSDKVGHPLLYGTTRRFLEYFGLRDLRELPRLEEFAEAYKDKIKTDQGELLLSEQEASAMKVEQGKALTVRKNEEEYSSEESPGEGDMENEIEADEA